MKEARILDGRAVAAEIRAELAREVESLAGRGIVPGLAAILVGDDPASQIYVGQKQKQAHELGMRSERVDLPGDVSADKVLGEVERLNRDPGIHGIIVQLPLPAHLDARAIQEAISPEKDVDGLHPLNWGRLALGDPLFVPCTPLGIQQLLLRSGVEIEGSHVVIVGRGTLVGRPLSILLSQKAPGANATVTLCHTGTRDLPSHTARADILVVAAGKPRAVGREHVRPGAVVVDVGIHRTPEGLVGDVDFAAVREVAGAITPVPGGVGPMTVAMLLYNTVLSARRAAGLVEG